MALLEHVGGRQNFKRQRRDLPGYQRHPVAAPERMVRSGLRVGRRSLADFPVDRPQLPLGHVGYPAPRADVFEVGEELAIVRG